MELVLAAALPTSASQLGYVSTRAETTSLRKEAVQIQDSKRRAALKYVVSLPHDRMCISHCGAISIPRLGRETSLTFTRLNGCLDAL